MQYLWKTACLWLVVIFGLPVYGGSGVEGNSDVTVTRTVPTIYKFRCYDLALIEEILEAQKAKAMTVRPQDEKLIATEYAARLARARAIAAAYAAKSKTLDKSLDSE